MILKVGSKFNHEHVDYEVLERYENYVLLQGKQYGHTLWITANIFNPGGNEIAKPFFNDVSPESKIFNKVEIKAFFDSEVRKMQIAQRAEKEANEKNEASYLRRRNKIRIERDAGVLILEMRTFVKESKSMDNLLKNKEFNKITYLSAIDYILKFYR